MRESSNLTGVGRFRQVLKAQRRTGRGFTLVELAVVVIVIGILVSTAMSNFIKAQAKAKVAAVIDNMHTTQIAAEAYATDTAGVFAPDPNMMGPYYPGGGNTQGGSLGVYPDNPINGASREIPFAETITDSAGINTMRNTPPGASPGGPGQCGYAQCDAPASTSYAVTGTNDAGKRVGSATGTTVLSNH